MHITTFLKNMAQAHQNDKMSHQIPIKFNQKRQSDTLVSRQSIIENSYGEHMRTLGRHKNSEIKIKYLDNHHPTLKTRLLKNKQQFKPNTESGKLKSKLRQKIEEKFMQIVNHRKQLIVQLQKDRKICHSSNSHRYSSYKDRHVASTMIRQIPDYAKNIMKPCKIQSVCILNRPLTARKLVERSSLKSIYFKKILPLKKERFSTIQIKKPKKEDEFNPEVFKPWDHNEHNLNSQEDFYMT